MDFSQVSTDKLTLVLLIVMAVSFAVLALYYGLVYLFVNKVKGKDEAGSDDDSQSSADPLPPVSVVLTVHNEANWLRETLPCLLEQNYPRYELVVVDFVSKDDTRFVLKLCAEHYQRLKIVTIDNDVNKYSGRKYPLSIGIKSAKNDIILLSEPDCVPKDFNWLRRMVQGYRDENTKIVLGFSGVRQDKGLFNWMQVYDNLTYNIAFLSSAMRGMPYTGSSRNLSYRRSFFFDHGAFYSHLNIPYGADDIFVNSNANRHNTAVVISPDGYPVSESKPSFGQWVRLRRERVSTRRLYPLAQKVWLSVHNLSVFLFYGAAVMLLLAQTFPWQIVAGCVLLKWVWQIWTMSRTVKFFNIKWLHWLEPLFEIYFSVANTFSALTPLSLKSKR